MSKVYKNFIVINKSKNNKYTKMLMNIHKETSYDKLSDSIKKKIKLKSINKYIFLKKNKYDFNSVVSVCNIVKPDNYDGKEAIKKILLDIGLNEFRDYIILIQDNYYVPKRVKR